MSLGWKGLVGSPGPLGSTVNPTLFLSYCQYKVKMIKEDQLELRRQLGSWFMSFLDKRADVQLKL